MYLTTLPQDYNVDVNVNVSPIYLKIEQGDMSLNNTMAKAEPQPQGMTIGKLARRARVTTRTIRYYEEIGLLQNTRRAANGYRIYNEGHLFALRLIRRGKQLGLKLDEIKELADIQWQDLTTDIKLINRSIEILNSYLETTRVRLKELEGYSSQLEGEIRRLHELKKIRQKGSLVTDQG